MKACITDSNQSRFIANVRRALGRSNAFDARASGLFSDSNNRGFSDVLGRRKSRTFSMKRQLLAELIKQGENVNVKVTACEDVSQATYQITALVREKIPEWGERKSLVAWKHPLIDRLKLNEALKEPFIPVTVTDMGKATNRDCFVSKKRGEIRKQVINSYIGVTSADYCVAETATLVMKARSGEACSVSLVPSIHVAVVELSQVVADLEELYQILAEEALNRPEGLTRCLSLVTGPSKTADIELVMVHGAHGPRELYLYVVTGENTPIEAEREKPWQGSCLQGFNMTGRVDTLYS